MVCLTTILETISIVSAAANIPTSHHHQQTPPHHNSFKKKRTSLHNIDANVLYTRLNLLSHKLGRNDMNALDTLRVLRREGRRRRHGIAPMRSNDFLIGFKTTITTISYFEPRRGTHVY